MAQLPSQQRDDGKQRQQHGGRASDGVVRPLSLGLHTEMGAALLKVHLVVFQNCYLLNM